MTHRKSDAAKDKDGKDRVNLGEVSNEGGGHGADPGHGAGEGEGDRADDGGEELAGVEVDDPPAHLSHVLAQHRQHHDGPLVGVDTQWHRRCGHAEKTPYDVVEREIWPSSVFVQQDERNYICRDLDKAREEKDEVDVRVKLGHVQGQTKV